VSRRSRLRSVALAAALALVGCGEGGGDKKTTAPATPPPAAPARAPLREPLVGGPFPTLLVTQAQFLPAKPGGSDATPGPAKLLIVRNTGAGWKTTTLEDPESNAFHKALPWGDGFLTIGANQAKLKTWRMAAGQWQEETHWSPKFGGKFDRLRDVEHGDVDGDGKDDLVIATHDQGVIVVVHPEDWRVEEVDHQANTFVHEIEIGDVDGDGAAEFVATVSEPNKLDAQQTGEVRMYKHTAGGWQKSVVDAPPDAHAKEALTADVDGDGKAEVFVSWEGVIGEGGKLVRPVSLKEYRWADGKFTSSVVATVPDRMMRAIAAGDVNGDGKIDIVAGAMSSGLWLFEQQAGGGWKGTVIDAQSSGFEHPVCLTDLDGDGALEIYVGAEDQQQLVQYKWSGGTFAKQVIASLAKGDITWNITPAKL
jgi:hypothetical protein